MLFKPCYELPLQIIPAIVARIKGFFSCCCATKFGRSKRPPRLQSIQERKGTPVVHVKCGSSTTSSTSTSKLVSKVRRPRQKSRTRFDDASATAQMEPDSQQVEPPHSPLPLSPLSPPPSAPLASPPPSPSDDHDGARVVASATDATALEHCRLAFHNKIHVESKQPIYPGTFSEYNSKVVQYGYIACFSSVFPLAAICAAAANLIELRIDSANLLMHRRPRYRGAQDIGSWQIVLNLISWIALPVNVLILTFSSWDFRNMIIVPFVLFTSPTAFGVHSCYEPAHAALFEAKASNFTNAFGALSFVSADATVSHHARRLGTRISYTAECLENVQDCYAAIGGVWWLPGVEYLPPTARTTLSYTYAGLCNEGSILHNVGHCNTCKAWINTVWRTQLIIALVIEHLLLLLKMCLATVIPDQPRWVVDENARKKFQSELNVASNKRRLLRASVDVDALRAEEERATELILPSINASDDRDDQEQSEEGTLYSLRQDRAISVVSGHV